MDCFVALLLAMTIVDVSLSSYVPLESAPQFSGSHTMLHDVLHSLQWAGWSNVSVSCHSCASLLHCAVQRQTMSSERQFEHTGVDRAAATVVSATAGRGGASAIMSNGLISVPRRIPPLLPGPRSDS
jgi:hypothetical protein